MTNEYQTFHHFDIVFDLLCRYSVPRRLARHRPWRLAGIGSGVRVQPILLFVRGARVVGQMTQSRAQSMSTFNRRVDLMYRALYLKEPLVGLAKSLCISRQTLYRILNKAQADERVMRSVAMRAASEEKKLNEEFER